MILDLNQRQSRILLVHRAHAAIIRTAKLGAILECERLVARLDVVLAEAPVGGIGRYQRRLYAVLAAALFVPDLVADDLDLRRHERETRFAQRLGLARENIGARSTQRRAQLGDWRVASAPSRAWARPTR